MRAAAGRAAAPRLPGDGPPGLPPQQAPLEHRALRRLAAGPDDRRHDRGLLRPRRREAAARDARRLGWAPGRAVSGRICLGHRADHRRRHNVRIPLGERLQHGVPAAREEPVHGRLRRRGRRLDQPPAEELHRGREAAVEEDAIPERREHALALGFARGGAAARRPARRASRSAAVDAARSSRPAAARAPRPRPKSPGDRVPMRPGRVAARRRSARSSDSLVPVRPTYAGSRASHRAGALHGSAGGAAAGPVRACDAEFGDQIVQVRASSRGLCLASKLGHRPQPDLKLCRLAAA